MKKGRKVVSASVRKNSFRFIQVPKAEKTSTENILEDAWKNLPYDFSEDERFMFLEIAQDLIKLEYKSNQSNQEGKN